MNLTILLSLVVAVTAVYVVKEFLAVLMLRKGRQVLPSVDKTIFTRQPDSVHLSRVQSPAWNDEMSVRQLAEPLLLSGFQDLGAYSVNRSQGMLIRILFQPQSYVAAHIFDHPTAGNWIEMATRYEDGSTDVVTTLAPTGAKNPDWFRRVQAEQGTPTRQIYERYLATRRQQGIEMLSAADAVGEFEDVYQKLALWRQESGVVRLESAPVAVKWAEGEHRAAAAGTIG